MTDRFVSVKDKGKGCHACKYVGSVPGSAHQSCKHPDLPKPSPMTEMMSIFASVGRAAPVVANAPEFGIKADAHGVMNGWFNWPYNYDPVWMHNCEKFEPPAQEKPG